ncbi:type IV pilus assembly protein PilN [Gammaproteobacteria bacterium]
MPQINLLPWREEKRKERQKEFIVGLVFSVFITAGALGYSDYYIEERISFQKEKNALLDKEIKKIKEKITEVENLQKKLSSLRARMDIIQRLQASRPEIVHLFDEIPRLLPEGVYLTSIVQKGSSLNFDGGAQSNTLVSTLMRNITDSKWVTDPMLDVIQSTQTGNERISKFTLKAKQRNLTDDKNNSQKNSVAPKLPTKPKTPEKTEGGTK